MTRTVTAEQQLRSFIVKFDPPNQALLRAARRALRKRLRERPRKRAHRGHTSSGARARQATSVE